MKKHDKDQVIKTGEKLFQTRGYHNTGTEDILQQSEYPRSSFYYHFKSKEGFAIEVLDQYGTNASDLYRKFLANDELGTPLKRLQFFAKMMTETAAGKKFKSECLVQKFSVECAALNDDLRQATELQLSKIVQVIKDCIVEGQVQGEIRRDFDAMELAELYHAQLYGGFILSRLRDDGNLMMRNLTMVVAFMKA